MFSMKIINKEGTEEDLVENLDPQNGSLKVYQVTGQVGEYTYSQLSYSQCTDDSFELTDVRDEVRDPYLNSATFCIDDIDEV